MRHNKKKNIFFCTLLLSGNKEISKLNKKFRKKNNSTDVLSFPFHSKKNLKKEVKKEKEIYLGDIIINLNKIKDKKKLKNFKLEFNKLWIHGLIHLFGFDHKREKDYIKMQKVESNYLSYITIMLEKYLSSRFSILYLTPFFLGLLTVFSFQPYNLTFLNFLILPIFFGLAVYINKKSRSTFRKKPYKKNLFIFGFLFGFGFYLSGISWITNSLTFDENFKILIPFALIFIPMFLGLFLGCTILFIGPYLSYNFSSILIFSGAMSFADFLRAKLFTGFPWNLWAYSFPGLLKHFKF